MRNAGVRITSGPLSGRRLQTPPGPTTRPTADKVRQAIFNVLANIPFPPENHTVLDLFAGSGALGLEALSRGAARAVFIDRAAEAVRCIAANARSLGLDDHVEIIRADVVKALPRLAPRRFNVVFIDPPYRSGDAAAALEGLVDQELLAPRPEGAIVVVEHDRRSPPPETIGLQSALALYDRRRYGDTEVSFYR
jgi:16S rRNA (guanine966-N2)-methyltransferase